MPYRAAIVEDNSTARTNIRSHLLAMGLFEISSFASGNELRQALRKISFDLIVFDFHLGQNKNGVEWVISLRQAGILTPSTGILFLTADRSPQVIGQIVDINPDVLMLKPYTISSLNKALNRYLSYRKQVVAVLRDLDNKDIPAALQKMEKVVAQHAQSKMLTDLKKLHARILLEFGDYKSAIRIYEQVLLMSEQVLWAQWGKIKCQYLSGQWDGCMAALNNLLGTGLARSKAFEWLAGLSFEQENYTRTEFYLDHIKDSELSVPATKLKSMAYQRQNKVIEALNLIQKKRDNNRETKERFEALTFELADFYLAIAEQTPPNNRNESLLQARKLVGVATRRSNDTNEHQKRDYLLAYAAILEGDEHKARTLSKQEHMQLFSRSDISTLTSAAKTWKNLGDEELANKLFKLARSKLELENDLSAQISGQNQVITSEVTVGFAEIRASELNEVGTKHYINRSYEPAMTNFYDAFKMWPQEPAYGLNLLNCMLDALKPVFKSMTVIKLINDLSESPLHGSNLQRFERLRAMALKDSDLFFPSRESDLN